MPLLPVSVAPRIASPVQPASAPLGLVVALAAAALVAVVAGFLLVALTLAGWLLVSPMWGLSLCVVGVSLALVARERAPSVRS